MPSFIVDAPHHHGHKRKSGLRPNADALIKLLNEQPDTQAHYGGAYREDTSLCQIIVVSPLTEDQIDDFLYRANGVDYIGVSMTSAD